MYHVYMLPAVNRARYFDIVNRCFGAISDHVNSNDSTSNNNKMIAVDCLAASYP